MNRQKGFTLVELMVGLVMIAILSGSVSMIIYTNAVEVREKTGHMMINGRTGILLVNLIRSDLSRMAFFPGSRTVYFAVQTERDGTGNRRDTLSFDALVPFTTEEVSTAMRFGRITYYAEEEFGAAYKKLMRRTVFINNEYTVEEDETETGEEKTEEPDGEAAADDAGTDDEETMEEIEIDRGEDIVCIARRIAWFRVDLLAGEEEVTWDELSISGQVPKALRISIGRVPGGPDTVSSEESGAEDIETFESVFLPVLAGYVSNPYRHTEDNENEENRKAVEVPPLPGARIGL
jgi:prepilin-type N-terminal cleavage/methylation domain-containing protein